MLKPTWACQHGCDLSKRACKHLEALLPGVHEGRKVSLPSKGRVKKESQEMLLYTGDVERYRKQYLPNSPADPTDATGFYRRLAQGNIKAPYQTVLIARFINNQTFEEIARANGMSVKQAFTIYREGLRMIKDGIKR